MSRPPVAAADGRGRRGQRRPRVLDLGVGPHPRAAGRVGHTQQQEQGDVPRAEPGEMSYSRSCVVVTQSRAPAPACPSLTYSRSRAQEGAALSYPHLIPFLPPTPSVSLAPRCFLFKA